MLWNRRTRGQIAQGQPERRPADHVAHRAGTDAGAAGLSDSSSARIFSRVWSVNGGKPSMTLFRSATSRMRRWRSARSRSHGDEPIRDGPEPSIFMETLYSEIRKLATSTFLVGFDLVKRLAPLDRFQLPARVCRRSRQHFGGPSFCDTLVNGFVSHTVQHNDRQSASLSGRKAEHLILKVVKSVHGRFSIRPDFEGKNDFEAHGKTLSRHSRLVDDVPVAAHQQCDSCILRP